MTHRQDHEDYYREWNRAKRMIGEIKADKISPWQFLRSLVMQHGIWDCCIAIEAFYGMQQRVRQHIPAKPKTPPEIEPIMNGPGYQPNYEADDLIEEQGYEASMIGKDQDDFMLRVVSGK